MAVALLWTYNGIKALSFLASGLVTPLAFRSLKGNALSLLLSFVSAILLEAIQGALRNGHNFHWYELIGKSGLIALGFAISLDFRYEIQTRLVPS
jgi:hypothetical protein